MSVKNAVALPGRGNASSPVLGSNTRITPSTLRASRGLRSQGPHVKGSLSTADRVGASVLAMASGEVRGWKSHLKLWVEVGEGVYGEGVGVRRLE